MNARFYRLGEYKVIESGSGELTWETHFGFGALREGRCFRKGSILFIGPAENDRLGLLKGEFLDQLRSLPAWPKTDYYCRGLEVRQCKSGKKVTKEEMLMWRLERETGQQPNSIAPGNAAGEVAYSLRGYEIMKQPNGQIVWKKYTGTSSVSSGACSVLEDILFIGPGKSAQSALNKRQFLADLELLPEWDQTNYYCVNLSLHGCTVENSAHQEKTWSLGDTGTPETRDAVKEYRERIRFRLKKLKLPGKSFQFESRWIKKALVYCASLLFYLITLLFRCLVRCCKYLAERWHERQIIRGR